MDGYIVPIPPCCEISDGNMSDRIGEAELDAALIKALVAIKDDDEARSFISYVLTDGEYGELADIRRRWMNALLLEKGYSTTEIRNVHAVSAAVVARSRREYAREKNRLARLLKLVLADDELNIP